LHTSTNEEMARTIIKDKKDAKSMIPELSVEIPSGVSVSVDGNTVKVKGQKAKYRADSRSAT